MVRYNPRVVTSMAVFFRRLPVPAVWRMLKWAGHFSLFE
jgi:hypothetical protein